MAQTLEQLIEFISTTETPKSVTNPIVGKVLSGLLQRPGYMGVATPVTNPGTPDGGAFYLAGEAGTYPNFGGVTVNRGVLTVITYSGTSWEAQSIDIASTLGSPEDEPAADGSAFSRILKNSDDIKTLQDMSSVVYNADLITSLSVGSSVETAFVINGEYRLPVSGDTMVSATKTGLVVSSYAISTKGIFVYQIGAEITTVSFNKQTKLVTAISVSNIGTPEDPADKEGTIYSRIRALQESGSGNIILEWDTDAATTRKKVPLEERKDGLQISYKPTGSANWVNEQYNGTSYDDTNWGNDTNWTEVGFKGVIFNNSDILRPKNAISDMDSIYSAFPLGNRVRLSKLDGFYVNAGIGEVIAYKVDTSDNTNVEIGRFYQEIDGIAYHSFDSTQNFSETQYLLLKGRVRYGNGGDSLYYDGENVKGAILDAAIILVGNGTTSYINKLVKNTEAVCKQLSEDVSDIKEIINAEFPSSDYSTMTLYNANWILANKYAIKDIAGVEINADAGKKELYIIDISEGTTTLVYSLYHTDNGTKYYPLPNTIHLEGNQYLGIKGVKKNTDETTKCYIGTTEYSGQCSYSVFEENSFSMSYNIGEENTKNIDKTNGFLSVESSVTYWDDMTDATSLLQVYIPNFSGKNPIGLYYKCKAGTYEIGIADLSNKTFEKKIDKSIVDDGTYYEDISNWGTLADNQYVAIKGIGIYINSTQKNSNVGYKILFTNASLIQENFGELAVAVVGKGLFSHTLKDIRDIKQDIANLQSGVGQPLTIFCYGDSLTDCRYAEPLEPGGNPQIKYDFPYPYWLGKYLKGFNVVRYSEGGINAQGFWERKVPTIDFRQNPNVIVIMLGTNAGLTGDLDADVNAFDDYEEYANTMVGCYCKIIEYTMQKAPQAQIILCTIPHSSTLDGNAQQAYPVIFKVAEKYSLPVIDVYNKSGISKYSRSWWQPYDGVHFSIESANKFATFIGSNIKSILSYLQE